MSSLSCESCNMNKVAIGKGCHFCSCESCNVNKVAIGKGYHPSGVPIALCADVLFDYYI